ncbi:MAG: hypothetical protein IRZ16_23330 [Myxococcaceae bacterium]|nr:hypothetical protein [Myxococcaceae bacterium]
MRNTLRLAAMVVAVGALVGCGGARIGSKEEAARVAFNAGNAGKGAQGGLAWLYASADTSGSFTTSCTHGGTATAALDLSGGNQNSLLTFQLTFDGCVEPTWDDPETEAVENEDVTYDGTVRYSIVADATQNSLELGFKMQGRIDLSGAISDFVDMDLTQTASFSVTSTGVSGKSTFSGTVRTSSESYVYDDETYEFSAEGKVTRVDSNS